MFFKFSGPRGTRQEKNFTKWTQIQYKNYSCMGSGSSFNAKAPDDVHKFSSLYQCWHLGWIERWHESLSCSKTTTLYWHSQVHKYRDYATVEQVNKRWATANQMRLMTGSGSGGGLATKLQERTILFSLFAWFARFWRIWRKVFLRVGADELYALFPEQAHPA